MNKVANAAILSTAMHMAEYGSGFDVRRKPRKRPSSTLNNEQKKARKKKNKMQAKSRRRNRK